jgi:hypothetical protein
MSAVVRGVPGAQILRNHRTESGFARPPVGDKGRGRASGSVTCINRSTLSRSLAVWVHCTDRRRLPGQLHRSVQSEPPAVRG